MDKKVYKNPSAGTPLLSTISSGCKTPTMHVKFCNLVKPFYYPNSPKIPRYSVTCLIDPVSGADFISGIVSIEKNEGVESIVKVENEKINGLLYQTGHYYIKFQSKEIIPVFLKTDEEAEPVPIELEDELAKGEKIVIIYDILRYTKKTTMHTEYGLSFKPTTIYYYPQET